MKLSRLSKSTAWYTAGNLFTRLTAFLLLPLYSNLIAPSDFGKYSLIASSYVLAGVLFQWGMQSALMKFYLEEKDNERRKLVFSVIFNFVSVTGIIFTLLIIIFSNGISLLILNSVIYSSLIKIAAAALLFETLASFGLQLLRIKETARRLVFYTSVSSFINIILNIYFIYILRTGIEGILIAQLVSNIVLFILHIPILKSELVYKNDFILLKKIAVFSIPFFAGGFFAVGVDVVDRFILEYLMGEREVGIYSLSYRIAIVMNIFVISLRAAWTPYSIRRFNEGNYSEEFGKILTKIIGISVIIFLTVSLLADDLFRININESFLFNPDYAGGVKIIPVILLAYLFNSLISFYSLYPYISGKSYHFLISDLLAFSINIPLNFLLIPEIGIMGAAAATFASYLLSLIYLVIIQGGRISINYQYKKIVFLGAYALVIFSAAYYVNNFFVDISLVALSIMVIPLTAGFRIKNARLIE